MIYNRIMKVSDFMSQNLDHDFEQVTVHDIPLLKKYLAIAQYEEANHNLVGFMIWLDTYPLWKYEGDEWLVLLGVHEGQLFIYMPLCKKEHFKDAIVSAKAIFDRYEVPFVLSCYTKEAMDLVLESFPEMNAEAFRDAADYVYLTDKLRTFSGKKLQKKRNHLNAFYKQYEHRWEYHPITKDDFHDVIEFLGEWHKDDDDYMMAYEKLGILRVLEHWDEVDATGGIIRIDGKLEAFVIGSRLSDQMCQMNVEKANDHIRGLYQAICKEFLSHTYLDTTYVNREDDMGLEVLRHAKEAYHPEYMIMKYRLMKRGNENASNLRGV